MGADRSSGSTTIRTGWSLRKISAPKVINFEETHAPRSTDGNHRWHRSRCGHRCCRHGSAWLRRRQRSGRQLSRKPSPPPVPIVVTPCARRSSPAARGDVSRCPAFMAESLDKWPLGAMMEKGLQIKTGQTHVQKFTPHLLAPIQRRRDRHHRPDQPPPALEHAPTATRTSRRSRTSGPRSCSSPAWVDADYIEAGGLVDHVEVAHPLAARVDPRSGPLRGLRRSPAASCCAAYSSSDSTPGMRAIGSESSNRWRQALRFRRGGATRRAGRSAVPGPACAWPRARTC